MEGTKPSARPSAAESTEETRLLDASPDMWSSDGTAYRGLAARLNFVAQESPVLQFTAKKVSERMSRACYAD